MQNFVPGSIQENPEIEKYQLYSTLYLIVMVIYSIIGLTIVIDFLLSIPKPGQFLATDKNGWWFVMIFQFIFIYITNKRTLFYWKWIEQRRFAAVIGGHNWDAVEQPAENPMALTLPTTITLHTNMKQSGKARIKMFGAMLAYIVVVSALIAWTNNLSLFISQNRFYDFLVFLAFFSLLVLAFFILSLFFRTGIRVVITEQGVQVGKSMVKWEEARLFAMYKGLNKSTTTYELSSVTAIVRWTVLSNPALLQIDKRHPVSVDEYLRRVRALNEVIVARTGLPLSYLR